VSGHVKSVSGLDLIKDADIIISKGADTIARVKTDEDGNFSLSLELEFNDELKLTIRHRRYFESEEFFKLQDEVQATFTFDLKLIKIIRDFQPVAPFYELNSEEPTNTNYVLVLSDLFEGYPDLCVEVRHYHNPEEEASLGKLRMENFKKQLDAAGIPVGQIHFHYDSLLLDCSNRKDCRGRIEGAVVSLEGSCAE
jgi:hypothetical protein